MTWFKERFEEISAAEKSMRSKLVQALIEQRKNDQVERINIEVKESSLEDPNLVDKAAISLTALANSEGGLIIWGFKDRTWTPSAIDNLKLFIQKLLEVYRTCSLPAVPGSDTRDAPLAGGKGYAITYVPRSNVGPHQAVRGRDTTMGKYFIRRTLSCEFMRHHELQDHFGRRPQPLLLPEVVAFNGKSEDNAPQNPFFLDIDLWNLGAGIARWSSVQLRIAPPISGTIPVKLRNIGFQMSQYEKEYAILESLPLLEILGIVYPHGHRKYVRLRFPNEAELGQNWPGHTVLWRASAEDMRPDIGGSFRIDQQMLVKARNNHCVIASFRTHEKWGAPLNPLIPIPINE